MVLECLIQMLDLRMQLAPGKPEKQHTCVRKSLMEYQLTEIAVSNDQDPLLLPGNRQDVLIHKTRRIVA